MTDETNDETADVTNVVNVNIPPTEMRKTLGALHKDIQTMLESQQYLAKIMRAKYLALVDEGFTKDEALKLCQL